MTSACICSDESNHDLDLHKATVAVALDPESPGGKALAKSVVGPCHAPGCACDRFRWRDITKRVKLPPEELYAWQVTGVAVLRQNRHWMPADILARWTAAIQEFRARQTRPKKKQEAEPAPMPAPVPELHHGPVWAALDLQESGLACLQCRHEVFPLDHDGRRLAGIVECRACGLLLATPGAAGLVGKVVFHAQRLPDDSWDYRWHPTPPEDKYDPKRRAANPNRGMCELCPGWTDVDGSKEHRTIGAGSVGG